MHTMAETPSKKFGENQAQNGEGPKEEAVSDTPKKSSSVRSRMGNFMRAFSPRKSASAGDIPEVTGPEPADEGDSQNKKKGGFGATFLGLGSKVKSPREATATAEATSDVATAVEKKVQESVGQKPAVEESAQAVVSNAEESQREASKTIAEAEQQVLQSVAGTEKRSKITVSAMAREVEAAQAKMVGHMENALAEARDVEQPAAPVAEEKVQDPKDKSGPPKSRRRGPLLSAVGLALGIGFIAIRLAMK